MKRKSPDSEGVKNLEIVVCSSAVDMLNIETFIGQSVVLCCTQNLTLTSHSLLLNTDAIKDM